MTREAREKAKFTPGPWWHSGARVYAVSLDALDDVDEPLYIAVADCDMDVRIDHDTTATANARLIAAAPEGYALAQFIKAHATQETLSTHVAVSFSEADAAMILNLAERFLSKAEGASQ